MKKNCFFFPKILIFFNHLHQGTNQQRQRSSTKRCLCCVVLRGTFAARHCARRGTAMACANMVGIRIPNMVINLYQLRHRADALHDNIAIPRKNFPHDSFSLFFFLQKNEVSNYQTMIRRSSTLYLFFYRGLLVLHIGKKVH